MINLLPYETKKQIKAARTNTLLIRYLFFLILAATFLGAASFASQMFLSDSKISAEQTIATNRTKSDSYLSVVNQSNQISAKISTAKNILDQQISYSSIITGLGSVIPSGVVVDGLSITNETIHSPITIKAHAKSSAEVTTLKSNIQSSSLFSGYDLQSLSTNKNDTTGYPVVISIGITINKGAAL